MKSCSIGVVLLLGLLLGERISARESAQNHEHAGFERMHGESGILSRAVLQELLHDRVQSLSLLRDRERIHVLLGQSELRRELLLHPGFIRQMLKSDELRQELLQNDEMMMEMLGNRVIRTEINDNREMMAEIEKHDKYRRINQERQTDILEELLDCPASGIGAVHR